jgi:hypothetical protein
MVTSTRELFEIPSSASESNSSWPARLRAWIHSVTTAEESEASTRNHDADDTLTTLLVGIQSALRQHESTLSNITNDDMLLPIHPTSVASNAATAAHNHADDWNDVREQCLYKIYQDQDRCNYWNACTPFERNQLVRIVQGMDRLYETCRDHPRVLPFWMMMKSESSGSDSRPLQQTVRVKMDGAIRNLSPEASSSSCQCSIYERIGRQGSQGPICILVAENHKELLENSMTADPSTTSLYERRGKAIVEMYHNDISQTVPAQVKVDITPPLSSESSDNNVMQVFRTHLFSNQLQALGGWIKLQCHHLAQQTNDDKQREDAINQLVQAIILFKDWIPYTMLRLNWDSVVALNNPTDVQINVLLIEVRLISAWVGDHADWIRTLWNLDAFILQKLYNLLHSYGFVVMDRHESTESTTVISACGRLFRVLQVFASAGQFMQGEFAGILTYFAAIHHPIQSTMPTSERFAVDSLQEHFQPLSRKCCRDVSLSFRTFAKHWIQFASSLAATNSSSGTKYCRRAVTIGHQTLWSSNTPEPILTIWLEQLMPALTRSQHDSCQLGMLTWSLHEELVLSLVNKNSPKPLLHAFLETATLYPDQVRSLNMILHRTPPHVLFIGGANALLSTLLKKGVSVFPSASYLILFGVAVRLDAIEDETVERACLKVARTLLLNELRRPEPSKDWHDSSIQAVDDDLISYRRGGAWWREACLDLRARQVYAHQQPTRDLDLTIAALQPSKSGIRSQELDAAPSDSQETNGTLPKRRRLNHDSTPTLLPALSFRLSADHQRVPQTSTKALQDDAVPEVGIDDDIMDDDYDDVILL